MTKALTVHNAEIKTATVEVRTLTISGKQVTLAVFKQLREEELVAEDGTLNGEPWGTVNYHPDKCSDLRQHIHVVWQAGSELRRSRVNYPSWWNEPYVADCGDGYAQARFCTNDHRLPDTMRLRGHGVDRSVRFRVRDIECDADAPDGPYIGRRDHECLIDSDLAELKTEILEEVRAEGLRREAVSARWRELNDLPQLFIAV